MLVGSIPLFGDIFDIAWKANRRNYRLLRLYLIEPHRHTSRERTLLLLVAALLAMVIALPIPVPIWLVAWLVWR